MSDPNDQVSVLAYAACGTCKKAERWLRDNGVEYTLRPIVDEPPTKRELAAWIPASGLPVRKWLNTSGQSYRALGKATFDAATDAEITAMLAADGKLVKRPVVVRSRGGASTVLTVMVGFSEEAYAALL